jgi:hypothetical protein
MSGAFPNTTKAKQIKIRGESPTFVSVTHSMKRQVRSRGNVHQWSIEAIFPRLERDAFAPIWAFVQSQAGRYESFTYIPPIYGSTRSATESGTLTVSTASTRGSSTVAVSGSNGGGLLTGDFIKFSNHDKVYMLTSDGSTSLSVFPPLHSDVSTTTTVTYSDVPFLVALEKDRNDVKIETNGLATYKLRFMEAL